MKEASGSSGMANVESQDWLVLSDSTSLPSGMTEDSLQSSGLFVTELTLPLSAPMLLLEIRSTLGWPRTFALFYEPSVGLVLLHRQGEVVVRHVLPGPFPDGKGQARVSYRFDAPRRRWELCLEMVEGGEDGVPTKARQFNAAGRDPMPVRLGDISELATCGVGTHRDPAILWFGLSKSPVLPNRLPWLGQRTPIETSLGPRMAGQLRAGDLVRTSEGDLVPLRAIRHVDLPSRGSFAPVFLRAPFFGERHDLLVAADQQIVLTGPEVEYLFGQEDILIKAGDLVDGQAAILDQRRAMMRSVVLNFDRPILVMADGCALLCNTSHESAETAPLRCLLRYEAMTLMTLLSRNARGRSASVRIA